MSRQPRSSSWIRGCGRASDRGGVAGVALPVLYDASEGVRRIVLEHHRPLLTDRVGPEPAFALERDERLDVVAHDPWKGHVRRRRGDIGEVEQALVARLD